VQASDPNTSGAKRTELRAPNNIEYDKAYWIALSAYVYDWGTLGSADQALFAMQVHSGDDSLGLSPSIALVTAYGGDGRSFQVFTTSGASERSVRYATQPIPFGRWVDFVFKFKHNTAGAGFLQVWMDGAQIVDHQGNLGYDTPGFKDYAKFGYYNWSGSAMGSTARKVLLRSPTLVADPTGTKYTPEQLRAHVQGAR
jgi:Polysaccharide lyase